MVIKDGKCPSNTTSPTQYFAHLSITDAGRGYDSHTPSSAAYADKRGCHTGPQLLAYISRMH